MKHITTQEIANYLSTEYIGQNIKVYKPSALHNVTNNSVFFIKKPADNYDYIPTLSLAIINKNLNISLPCTTIKSMDPRQDFIKILKKFFTKKTRFGIDPSVKIPKSSYIHPRVYVGKNVIIKENVYISEGCVIHSNVYLGEGVSIGENCVIKPGAVIGTSGFGYDISKDTSLEHFPHFGSVKIGKNVHIGANTTIDQGTLSDTIIEDNVKIDNLAHIAHNCIIKKDCIITACAEISGGVTIGEGSWVSPNVSIKQKVTIGNNTLIGLGSVVIKDITDKEKVMGFDAMTIREYLSFKKNF